jgi:hypothetical protein
MSVIRAIGAIRTTMTLRRHASCQALAPGLRRALPFGRPIAEAPGG